MFVHGTYLPGSRRMDKDLLNNFVFEIKIDFLFFCNSYSFSFVIILIVILKLLFLLRYRFKTFLTRSQILRDSCKEIKHQPALKRSDIYSYFEKGCRKKCARDNPER